MQEHELPTWNQIVANTLDELNNARNGLSEARDQLHSDWRPDAGPPTNEAAQARIRVFELIGKAKNLIDAAKNELHDARGR